MAALVAAPIAEMPIRWAPSSEGGEIAAATLFAGVLLTGWVLWWFLVARPARANWVRGGVTGVLVACIAYPIVLFLAEFLQVDWQSRSAASSLPERLEHVLVLAGFGLLTTGFAATLVLAPAGMATAIVQDRLDGQRPPGRHAAAGPRRWLEHAFQGLSFCAAAIVILLVAAFIALSLLPMQPLVTPAATLPAQSHAEALDAFALVQEHEASLPLHPRCGSVMLTHGEKVAEVVIFFHGLTNCPAQADELAPWLFGLGYNVLVPRLPGHGEADPLTLALADVSAEDFVETALSSVALAQGLGDNVIVVGLSAGGTLTAHQAQHESKVANSISVAPFFAPGIVPRWAAQAATNLLLLMPNKMVWWDPRAPYSSPEMDYAYPRFATHALAQIMRLGRIVAGEASAGAPAAQQMGFLLNEADLAVNNGVAHQVAADWGRHGEKVVVRILPQAKGLPHDLIDPRQPDAAVDIIYPMLLEMMSPVPAKR
ncbi:MAG: alpha/beta fold hydrolase [Devosia sp.]